MAFVTNESFWKELENICRIAPLGHPAEDWQTNMRQQTEAIRLLRQGYRENLDLICATSPFEDDPTDVCQLHAEIDDQRLLICFTSFENGYGASRGILSPFQVGTLPCRFVLGNMMNQSVFQGLIFDVGLGPGFGMIVLREYYRLFNPTGDPDYPPPENCDDPFWKASSAGTQETPGSSTGTPETRVNSTGAPGISLKPKKRKKKKR